MSNPIPQGREEMSPKRKSAGKKTTATRKRRAAGKKAASTRKGKAASRKGHPRKAAAKKPAARVPKKSLVAPNKPAVPAPESAPAPASEAIAQTRDPKHLTTPKSGCFRDRIDCRKRWEHNHGQWGTQGGWHGAPASEIATERQ